VTEPVDSITPRSSPDTAESERAAVPLDGPPRVADEGMPPVDLSWVTTELIRHEEPGQDQEITR
jgi:hypothetical protein